MTWPSFFAASISAGVTGSGGGAADAMTRVENAAPGENKRRSPPARRGAKSLNVSYVRSPRLVAKLGTP